VPVSLPRLRAPRDDGTILAAPALAEAGDLLARNRQALATADVTLLGKPIGELRRLARDEAWDACRRYHMEAGEPLPVAPVEGQSWLLAGHQPELFHPGVWFKNFALRGLAQQHDAFSLNLVVDNDAARSPLLRVPTPAHVASVPFDRWQGESPYEERPVLDEALFAGLPERVERFHRDWPFEPMLPAFWREALRQRERTPLLGERIAAARRAFERRWGCTQAEVPLSRLCQGEAFAIFAGQLLVNASRLRGVYNDAVHEYRRRYRLKSVYHPVPDLAAEGDWYELPLWAWRAGQGRRARLFVRQTGGELHLRAGGDSWPSLPGDPDRLVTEWRTLEARGYKVRTRALTTTLFARLLLGDLFLHGIGGGKYDELTDVLLSRFFGAPVPGYVVLTATLLLPLPRYPVDTAACRRLAREHRDVWYNPQRHFTNGVPSAAREIVHAKNARIAGDCATRAERRARFRELRTLNEQLRSFLASEEVRLRHARDECRRRLHVNDVLGRRDYAFCLYPEKLLREFYAGLLHRPKPSA
jgi:hypothetical protein